MFQKILVAEDLDSISISIVQALTELSTPIIHHAKYCDEAYLKIKKAIRENFPYDLLISDLSFKNDHTIPKLSNGEELIKAAKQLQPNLKVIVFTIEDKSYRIRSLFNNHGINGYLSKGRNSIPQLKDLVLKIYDGETTYITPELSHLLIEKSIIEIEDYDITVLKLMSKGYTLEEISLELKNESIQPNSCSSIEKRITRLKMYFKATNNVQLIATTKDLGLI